MVNSIKLFGFGNLDFPKIQYLYKHAKEWVSFVLLLKRGICAVPANQEIYVSYVLALMYRMGTSQGSSPDYFKGQSHILFKARTTWTWDASC